MLRKQLHSFLPEIFSLQVAKCQNLLIIFQATFLRYLRSFQVSFELSVVSELYWAPGPSTNNKLPLLTSTREPEPCNAVRLHCSLLPNKLLVLSCNGIPQIYANEGALIFTMLIQSFQKSYLWAHNFMLWLCCIQMRAMFCFFPFLQIFGISSTNGNITKFAGAIQTVLFTQKRMRRNSVLNHILSSLGGWFWKE